MLIVWWAYINSIIQSVIGLFKDINEQLGYRSSQESLFYCCTVADLPFVEWRVLVITARASFPAYPHCPSSMLCKNKSSFLLPASKLLSQQTSLQLGSGPHERGGVSLSELKREAEGRFLSDKNHLLKSRQHKKGCLKALNGGCRRRWVSAAFHVYMTTHRGTVLREGLR